ncbi:MAG: hypothetical protein ACR2M1_13920 [Gemmatimonadaceae bacterium]
MRQIPYEQFASFEHVYLEDSYVLNITTTEHSAEFTLDLVLLEGHPLYQRPSAGEQHCFRRALLHFFNAKSVGWIDQSMRPSEDANGEVDYGNIDVMYLEDGEYHVAGEWGELRIVSSPPVIDVIQDH